MHPVYCTWSYNSQIYTANCCLFFFSSHVLKSEPVWNGVSDRHFLWFLLQAFATWKHRHGHLVSDGPPPLCSLSEGALRWQTTVSQPDMHSKLSGNILKADCLNANVSWWIEDFDWQGLSAKSRENVSGEMRGQKEMFSLSVDSQGFKSTGEGRIAAIKLSHTYSQLFIKARAKQTPRTWTVNI